MDSGFLISEVLSKESLWNVTDKDYYNRRVTGSLWESVAEKMGCSVDDCKKKWKGLRDRYRVELKKEYAATKHCIEGKCWSSSWIYFNTMSFLRKHMSPSESSGNANLGYPKSPKSESNDIFDVQDETLHGPLPDQDISEERKDFTVKSRKRKIREDFRQKFLDLEEKKIILLQEMGQEEEETDDMLFFKSVLGYMADLPPIAKLRIRNKLTSALMEEVELHTRMSGSYSGETYGNTSTRQMYTETCEIASIKPEAGLTTYTLNSSHNVNSSSLSQTEEHTNSRNNLLNFNGNFS